MASKGVVAQFNPGHKTNFKFSLIKTKQQRKRITVHLTGLPDEARGQIRLKGPFPLLSSNFWKMNEELS